MLRFKQTMLFGVLCSKSWILAANILLAVCVTTAGEAKVTNFVLEDPTEPNSVKVNLGAACEPGTTVQTDRGTVCGIVVNGINSWQGIPFAAPPIENLRWAPPQPAAAWSGTLQATAYASQCMQTSGGHEDCLYLNVWAPPG